MEKPYSPSIELASPQPSSLKGTPLRRARAILSPLMDTKPSTEDRTNSPSTVQKALAELVGTYLLVFVGCTSLYINQRHNITIVGIAFTWSLVVMAVIYTIGHISGAHLNPAVSVAFAVTGQFPWIHVPLYSVAQLLGSVIASVNLRWLFSGDKPEVIISLPASSANDLEVIVWEIIASFILMFVICGAAADGRAHNQLAGVAVGGAVFLDVIITGTISGASMNPARSLGPAIVVGNYKKIWLYIFSPVIGTVTGATVYHFLQMTKRPQLRGGASAEMSSIEDQGKSLEIP